MLLKVAELKIYHTNNATSSRSNWAFEIDYNEG